MNESGTSRGARHPWRLARWLVQAAVLGLVGWYAISRLEWEKLREIRPAWGWVALAALLQFAYLAAYAGLWHALTLLHKTSLPFGRAASLWGFSLIGKYVPLKIGMPALRILGYRRAGARAAGAVGLACYLEWFLAVYAGVIVGTALAFVSDAPEPIPHFRLLCAGLLVVIFPFIFPPLLSMFLRHVGRLLKRPMPEVGLKLRSLLAVLAGYCFAWLIAGTSLYCLLRALHPVELRWWDETCMVYALAGIAGIAVLFAPAGLGVRDGLMMMLLGTWLPPSVAIAAAVLARVLSVLVELAVVGVAWGTSRSVRETLRLRKTAAAEEAES